MKQVLLRSNIPPGIIKFAASYFQLFDYPLSLSFVMRCPNSRGKYNPLSSLPALPAREQGMDLRVKVPISEKNERRNKAQP